MICARVGCLNPLGARVYMTADKYPPSEFCSARCRDQPDRKRPFLDELDEQEPTEPTPTAIAKWNCRLAVDALRYDGHQVASIERWGAGFRITWQAASGKHGGEILCNGDGSFIPPF